jgi:hypothetical protein
VACGPALSTQCVAGSAVPRPGSVSSFPSLNRACSSPAPGFPRPFTAPQCPPESSGGIDGVISLHSIHQPLPAADTQTKYDPFPPPRFCCGGLSVLWTAPTPAPLSPTSRGHRL